MDDKEIIELENNLREAKYNKAEKERQERREKETKWKNKNNINLYHAGDYAWLSVGNLNFYYWYEETFCKKHWWNQELCEEAESEDEKTYEKYCEEREICFVASDEKWEILRIPTSKLFPDGDVPWDFYEWVLYGIAFYLKQKNKNEN